MNPGLTARFFLSPAQRRSLAAGVGIYVFHKIAGAPRGTRDPFEYTEAGQFRAKLSALAATNYRCMTLDELATTAGQKPTGFSLTFDDGYRNVIENALPLLQEFGFLATLYVVAGKLGGENTWDQAKGDVTERLADTVLLREWIGAGHELGSHSLTHANLRKLSMSAAREEITGSRKLLEDTFGIAVRHFCYPYGAYTGETRQLVEEAGYATATTMKFGCHNPGESLFELERMAPLSAGELARKAWHRLLRRVSGG